MAKEDIKKFRNLLISDSAFQEKLLKASESYTGAQDEKSVFNNLLLPLAKEQGFSATYEEFKEYIGAFAGDSESELSEDELELVAGGKNSGIGLCVFVGGGDLFGSGTGYACQAVGLAPICVGVGGD